MKPQASETSSTGTPSGVDPIRPGERLNAKIEGVGTLTVTVGEAE